MQEMRGSGREEPLLRTAPVLAANADRALMPGKRAKVPLICSGQEPTTKVADLKKPVLD